MFGFSDLDLDRITKELARLLSLHNLSSVLAVEYHAVEVCLTSRIATLLDIDGGHVWL